ncbi:zinc ribbon domain-containing protein [bacterium]|nr:zinc ribbon domain-containing protein [bacterium]MBU1674787.1 zinc ribbon domain-containing protein [bacterium]
MIETTGPTRKRHEVIDMPMYEFKCVACGAEFEELVTMAEVAAGEVPCPACASKQVERQISTFACGGESVVDAGGDGGCGHAGFG